jgi:hypothetical protein
LRKAEKKTGSGRASVIFKDDKEMRKSLSAARHRRSVSMKGGRPTTEAMDEASLQNHIEREKLMNVLRDHASARLMKYSVKKSESFSNWIKDHTSDKIDVVAK